jgi:hypothetical protein
MAIQGDPRGRVVMMGRATTVTRQAAACLAAAGLGLVGGCGLEGLFYGIADEDYLLPVSIIRGTTTNQPVEVQVFQADGTEIEPVDSDVEGGSFVISLDAAEYSNLRLVATQGELRLEALLTSLAALGEAQIALDADSTTQVLVVDAALSATDKSLQVVEPKVLAAQIRQLQMAFDAAGAPQDLRAMVGRILDAAAVDGSTRVIRSPQYDRAYKAEASTLDLDWLAAAGVDYDGDGTADTSSVAFDTTLGLAAQSISLEGCLNQEVYRVVFEVDFNEGRKDGNCDVISRFRWVRDEPGKSMFFVGGFHMESPIQDPNIDSSMGNRGGWVPNIIPMADDGTRGDAVAGDNVWTIFFDLPRGARIGYKYTWGTQGALWTGSEEWPGNQHILEIIDVNGDNIVYRRDNFGDEATNKDKVNLNRRGNGMVTWDTDVNGDGIPDARERRLDTDFDCTLDEWVTPTGVGPATVDCDQVGG